MNRKNASIIDNFISCAVRALGLAHYVSTINKEDYKTAKGQYNVDARSGGPCNRTPRVFMEMISRVHHKGIVPISASALGLMYVISLEVGKCIKLLEKLQNDWHGITNGDMIPHQDDFQRTAQLFWSFVFGNGLVCCFFLWAAFPSSNGEWHYITGGVSLVFLACVGLRTLGKPH